MKMIMQSLSWLWLAPIAIMVVLSLAYWLGALIRRALKDVPK